MATTTTVILPIRSSPTDHNAKPKKRNIVNDFAAYFGNQSQLANWQRLCHDVGLADDLPSIRQCRTALNSVYVNIHDLIDKVAVGQKPIRFNTCQELARWTLKKRKIYPKDKAKKGGPVRASLVHLFVNTGA